MTQAKHPSSWIFPRVQKTAIKKLNGEVVQHLNFPVNLSLTQYIWTREDKTERKTYYVIGFGGVQHDWVFTNRATAHAQLNEIYLAIAKL